MADPEPTLRDVLTELRELRADHGERLEALSGKVSKQGADLAAVRAEMATRDDLAAVRAEMATRDDLADLRADVRAQLEALRADHGAQLEALRADHGAQLEALSGKVEALRADLEKLGRETRGGWAELRRTLLRDLPAAVVEAIGPELRDLRADVDQLKRKVG